MRFFFFFFFFFFFVVVVVVVVVVVFFFELVNMIRISVHRTAAQDPTAFPRTNREIVALLFASTSCFAYF